jgi:hypothetical protein
VLDLLEHHILVAVLALHLRVSEVKGVHFYLLIELDGATLRTSLIGQQICEIN